MTNEEAARNLIRAVSRIDGEHDKVDEKQEVISCKHHNYKEHRHRVTGEIFRKCRDCGKVWQEKI